MAHLLQRPTHTTSTPTHSTPLPPTPTLGPIQATTSSSSSSSMDHYPMDKPTPYEVAGPLLQILATFVTNVAMASPAATFVRRKEALSRAGSVLRSESEVLSCFLRYERMETPSEIVPVIPFEKPIRVALPVLDRVMDVLHCWDPERISFHHPGRHSPARILLDNGKVLLLHPAV